MSLTQEKLKSLFRYDQDTGWFYRRTASPGFSVGQRAGWVGERGYVSLKIDGATYKAHRLAWLYVYGEWPKAHIDHKDGNTSNNRIDNLRDATREQNLSNCRKYKNNSSGLKGVGWHKKAGKWYAQIQHNGHQRHLGVFDTKEGAHAVYVAEAVKLFGEFARIE